MYKKLNEQYFWVLGNERGRGDLARVGAYPALLLRLLRLPVRATGYAAAIALSRRILREGEPAVKDYLGFLSGGCSADPITPLRGAGVDMASPKPIEDATKLFDEMISEMEKILN